jgi:hypothetical protein
MRRKSQYNAIKHEKIKQKENANAEGCRGELKRVGYLRPPTRGAHRRVQGRRKRDHSPPAHERRTPEKPDYDRAQSVVDGHIASKEEQSQCPNFRIEEAKGKNKQTELSQRRREWIDPAFDHGQSLRETNDNLGRGINLILRTAGGRHRLR